VCARHDIITPPHHQAASEKSGADLEAEVKQLSVKLGPLSISAVEKERFRQVLAGLVDRVKRWRKVRGGWGGG
jgi:hypothetical protein